jgi:hypothetical protein
MQAQLDWYKYHEDSEPIEVWGFTRLIIEHPSTLFGSSSTCSFGEEGTAVDAHTGEFIVEGFTGSKPTPCPTG